MHIKTRFILHFIFLFLIPTTIYGQYSDPYTIFDSSVEIRVNELPPISSNFDFDDELRLLLLDNQLVPYPYEVTRVFDIAQVEGRILLQMYAKIDSTFQSSTWEFDAETRQFSEFEAFCSPRTYSLYSLEEQPWTITEIDNQSVLCNTLNGEISPPLPEGYDWIIDSIFIEPEPKITISPDSKIIAFMGTETGLIQAQSWREIYLFSYQLESGLILDLGQFDAEDVLEFEGWIDSQVIFRTGNTSSIGSMCTLITDATQVDTIYTTLCTQGGGLSFLDNPPRFVLSYENGSLLCGQTTYDIETHEQTHINLNGLCRPEFGDIEAVGYYRDIPMGMMTECCTPPPVELAEAPLIRYDSRTGERQELYRGEIEAILWVSDDEHYAILVLDNSGKINTFPYLDYWVGEMQVATATLIDLYTGETIKQAYIDEWDANMEYAREDWAINHGIFPLNGNSFLSIECWSATNCLRQDNSAYITSIIDKGVTQEFIVGDPILLTPDKQRLLIWSKPYWLDGKSQDTNGISIYDLETGEIKPLIRDDLFSGSEITLTMLSDNETVRAQVDDSTFDVRFEPDGSYYVEIILPSEPAIGEYLCLVTTKTGVNVRNGASADTERFAGVTAGERFIVTHKQISESDQKLWYALDGGGWIREDFLRVSRACASLGESATPLDLGSTQVTTTITTDCQVKLLSNANLRIGAGSEFEIGGSRLIDEILDAKAQSTDSNGFRWWQLTNSGLDDNLWVREDLTEEIGNCHQLPAESDSVHTDTIIETDCQVKLLNNVNLRTGAGSEFEIGGSRLIDEILDAKAQSTDSNGFRWWQLMNSGLDDNLWVREDLTEEIGNCDQLPEADTISNS